MTSLSRTACPQIDWSTASDCARPAVGLRRTERVAEHLRTGLARCRGNGALRQCHAADLREVVGAVHVGVGPVGACSGARLRTPSPPPRARRQALPDTPFVLTARGWAARGLAWRHGGLHLASRTAHLAAKETRCCEAPRPARYPSSWPRNLDSGPGCLVELDRFDLVEQPGPPHPQPPGTRARSVARLPRASSARRRLEATSAHDSPSSAGARASRPVMSSGSAMQASPVANVASAVRGRQMDATSADHRSSVFAWWPAISAICRRFF
jgi:hypothetical protein